ncbi:transposase [Glaesserella parasuis]|nr:transposase [Glaesserella parasuis]MDP0377164.1 transposase [Glaesserella parasuis]
MAMNYTENAKTILALNHQFVKQGGNIMCDENMAYQTYIPKNIG